MIHYSLFILISLLVTNLLMPTSNDKHKKNNEIITTIEAYKQSTQQFETASQIIEKQNINQQIQEYFSIAEKHRCSTNFDHAIMYYKKVRTGS
jgi:hypothetical protein